MQCIHESPQRPQSFPRALRSIHRDHSRANLWGGHPPWDIRHVAVWQEDRPHLFTPLTAMAMNPDLSLGERMERIINGDRLRSQNVSSL